MVIGLVPFPPVGMGAGRVAWAGAMTWGCYGYLSKRPLSPSCEAGKEGAQHAC